MNKELIIPLETPKFKVDFENGNIEGESLIEVSKKLKNLFDIFMDKQALANLDTEKLVYSVKAILPVNEGVEGGLFYGKTIIEPGKVGNEYHMTKGHFHQKADRAEFYWGIQGEGVLLLMDEKRNCWAEKMFPGSLHYIDGFVAHRTINIGSDPLSFGACWPSDAGHNYQEIIDNGFSARMLEVDGKPVLVSTEK